MGYMDHTYEQIVSQSNRGNRSRMEDILAVVTWCFDCKITW
jgi:hypothetical protein